jgi:serine/threonine protein kinase
MAQEERGDERDPSESVLEELLAELERGGEFNLAGFQARHPGHETLIARWLKSAHALDGLKPAGPSAHGSASSIAAGTVMGDFVVESLIARGGMGVVYRARQQSLGGRDVALKVLPLEGVSPKSQERFRREARAAAEVHHPNLAAVYGFGAEEGILFYAMQLVEGPSLRDVLEDLARRREQVRAQPEYRTAVGWARDVAAALDALHRRGLVHRDVKPSNIMLAHTAEHPGEWPDAPAILVDFGLVRRVDSHTLTEGSISAATPSYAAPEQLIGIEVDARADVFGIGVTLHDLLSARLPSERLQAAAGLEPIESLVPGIDRDLAAIVGKATDPKPEWRYAHAGALLEDLNAWLDGRPVSARRMGVIERTRRHVSPDLLT